MFKPYSTLLCVMIGGVCLFGSANAGERTEYGLHIGPSWGNLTGDIETYYAETSAKMGVTFGISAAIPQGERFYFQPEINYFMTGAKNADNANERLSLTYMQIPVLLRFMVIPKGAACPYIEIGPAAGLLVSSKYILGNISADAMDLTTKIDGSLIIGGGLDFPYGEHKIVIAARYLMGFVNINDTRGETKGLDVKNRSLTLTLGYVF